jgi:hypothetical protein
MSKLAVGSMTPVLENAKTAALSSDDLITFRDASAGNLFLLEGLIETDPDNTELRLNAAMMYFSYAFAFMEEHSPGYASLLYRKGFEHGQYVLLKNKKFAQDWSMSYDDFAATLPELREKDVPAAVWTAVNWAQFISLHLDSTAVMRDIPKVTSLLERVAELDGTYFEGLVYTMIGALHAFRPPMMGGDPEASLAAFERAFEISGDSFLVSRYLYARFYLYRIQDGDAFESTLTNVIERDLSDDDPYQLLNLIAQQKSEILLGEIDELF